MAAAPIILEMDVHCHLCANKIRKSIRDMFDVERVLASAATGIVVVHGGDVDVTLLRRLLQRAMGRPVNVLSDGGRDSKERSPMYFDGMRHMAPTQYAPHPPPYAWDRSPYTAGSATAYPYPPHWSTPPAPPHPYAYPPGVFVDTSRGNSCSIM